MKRKVIQRERDPEEKFQGKKPRNHPMNTKSRGNSGRKQEDQPKKNLKAKIQGKEKFRNKNKIAKRHFRKNQGSSKEVQRKPKA